MKEQSDNLDRARQAPIHLFNYIIGFMKSQAICVAAELGIADLLKDGPRPIDDLAKLTGANENALYRLLRALAGIGIFQEKENRSFEMTPMAVALRRDALGSLRPLALLTGDRSWWDSWGDLLNSVGTEEPAIDRIMGMDYIEYLDTHPGMSQIHNECMTSLSQVSDPAIAESFDFSGFKKIVDVGGNTGGLLSMILKRAPHLAGILFDRPQVIDSIEDLDDDLAGRCELISGNFFHEVPAGGDLYILKQILHDWSDDLSIRILKNIRKAMDGNGRILVIEVVIGPGPETSVSKFFDLHMLVTSTGGRERTEAEFRRVVNAAGFEIAGILPTPGSYSVIELRCNS